MNTTSNHNKHQQKPFVYNKYNNQEVTKKQHTITFHGNSSSVHNFAQICHQYLRLLAA